MTRVGVRRFGSATAALIEEEWLLDRSSCDGRRRALAWVAPPALVFARREARCAGFRRGLAWAQARGLEVGVRLSGGSGVPIGPGTLNLALVAPLAPNAALKVEEGYAELLGAARAILAPSGLVVTAGEMPGAYCDGRFNLLAAGRKIAGTAQRVRQGPVPVRLAHVALSLCADTGADMDRLNGFQAAAGLPERYDPGRAASAAELLGLDATARDRLMRRAAARAATWISAWAG